MITHTRNPRNGCESVAAWDNDWVRETHPGIGSGQIFLTEKTFCSEGICEDLKVCWLADGDGKSAFYLPVNGEYWNLSQSKVQKLESSWLVCQFTKPILITSDN